MLLAVLVISTIKHKKSRITTNVAQKLGNFYDARKAQFENNPELCKQKALAKGQYTDFALA
ncbi:MAG: hypothetical protein FWK04_21650 [Nostoc sp. GBBB01]|nr:hypothetical protein [Nostoc sp. GBBB01]